MRFTLVLIIWIVFVGGLKLYTVKRDEVLATEGVSPADLARAEAIYSLRLTPTFSVEQDPFALQSETGETSGFELRLNGSRQEVMADQLRRGEVLELKQIQPVLQGHNELYLKASPPLGESMLDQGVRIQVLKDNLVVAGDTIWGEKGALVLGTVHFTISDAEKDHDH